MNKRLSLILLNIILCLCAFAGVCGYSATVFADTTYTVKFWLDDAKTEEYVAAEQQVAEGAYAQVPVTPLKDGNVFLYWKSNGERFSFKNTPITAETNLVAEWYELDAGITVMEMFSVKFNVGGTVVNEQSVKKGEDAIAPTTFNVPAGKIFTGWDGAFNDVQQDIVISAILTDAEYTVNIIGFNGVTVKTFEGVNYGNAIDVGSIVVPEVANYHVSESDKFDGDPLCIVEDCDITIKYVPNVYTATFTVSGEIYGAVQTINYGEYVTFPSIPNKTGYIFLGWFDNADDIAFDFNSIIENDVVIYAKFQAIENPKYDVEFHNYNGELYSTQRVEEGKTAIAAGRPTREGYDFLGWFISGETETPYDFNTPVTEDISLNAIYRIKSYTVTVVSDGEIISTQTVKYGGKAVEPEITAKEGYIFTGFDASFKDIRNDIVINATFCLKTFAVMFIDSYGKKMCATQYVEYGKRAKAPKVPELEGYTFLQWSEDFESVKDDTVVIPLYKKITYGVTYMLDGEIYAERTVEYGRLAINLVPTKEDKIFRGWFIKELCEPADAYDFNTVVTADLTIYGAWDDKPVDNFTVTFKIGGEIYKIYSVEQGQNCPKPDNPDKYGYNFVGWDKEYDNITEDIEVNAVFTEKEYKVRLTGFQGAGADDYFTVTYGTYLTEDLFPKTAPDKEGYEFTGWNYDPNTPVTQDISVSARYIINVYTVTFKVEGEIYDVQNVNHGSYARIPNQPYVYGKTFYGWYMGENAFNFRLGITADMEVNAKLGAVERTVYYYLDNKYYAEEKYEVGAKITEPAAPDISEHTDFFGWQGLPEDMIMPNATVSVYGYTYTYHEYTVTYYINNKVYAQDTYYDGDAVTMKSAPSAEDLARLADGDTVFIAWNETLETMPTYNCRIDATLKKYYTLTYSIDGGYYHEVLKVLEGTAITPKGVPDLPDGVVFVRWENEPETMPQYNMVVEGVIMRNYVVRYYVNDVLYREVEVFQGSVVTPIDLPTEKYEDFVVDAWGAIPEIMPTEDIRVDAVIRLKYAVIYYIGNDVCWTVKIPVGDAIPEYIPKTDENTVFVAWLNLPGSGTMPAENINVYASVKHYFTLIYVIDEQVYRTFRILEGEPIQLIAYENDIEGIIFYEWQDVIDVMTGSDYTITASIKKLYKYALTYYVDGEKFREFKVYEGDTVTPLQETPKFDNPDIVFNGWQGEPTVMPEKDVNVYADIKYYYVITYYVRGEVYDTVRAIAGTPVQKHAAPDNLYEYEIFVGWQGEPELMPIDGARVESVIRTLEKHTITYYIDNEVFDTREYYATLPVTPYGVPQLEDENRIFDGWNNEPTVMPNYDMDVYGYSHVKEDDLTVNRFMLNTAFVDDKELILTFEVTEDVNLAGFTGVIVFDEKAFKDCRIDILDSDYMTAAVVDNEVRFAWAYHENITNEKSFITVMLGRTGPGVQGNVSLNIFGAYAWDEEGTAVPVEYSVN